MDARIFEFFVGGLMLLLNLRAIIYALRWKRFHSAHNWEATGRFAALRGLAEHGYSGHGLKVRDVYDKALIELSLAGLLDKNRKGCVSRDDLKELAIEATRKVARQQLRRILAKEISAGAGLADDYVDNVLFAAVLGIKLEETAHQAIQSAARHLAMLSRATQTTG